MITLNACSASLFPLLLRKMFQDLRTAGLKAASVAMSPAQVASYEQLGHHITAHVVKKHGDVVPNFTSFKTLGGLPIEESVTMPKTEIHFRDKDGNVVGRIECLAIPQGFC